MSRPALLTLGDTYVYLEKECGWEYELSSLNPPCLHESDKLVKSINETRQWYEQLIRNGMFSS